MAPAKRSKNRKGSELIPVLTGGLRRAWVPREQLLGLHPSLEKLLKVLELGPVPRPSIEQFGEEALHNYLWTYPPVIVPIVAAQKEVAQYQCIAGIESFQLAMQLPSGAQIHVLRAARRVDHDRMVPAAIAELRYMQMRLRADPSWMALADRNLARLASEHRRFVSGRQDPGDKEPSDSDSPSFGLESESAGAGSR